MKSPQPSISLPATEVTGLVLAGGLGRRMSVDGRGVNKALQQFRGKPLIEHVVVRLAPQVASIMLNVNENIEAFRPWPYRLVPDLITGFQGPLAGVHAGLIQCSSAWLVIVPCDSPFLADDLVQRLLAAALDQQAEIAVASHQGQWQPVFALIRRELHTSLATYLGRGDRKIDLWFGQHKTAVVEFDEARAFLNFNRLDELQRYEH